MTEPRPSRPSPSTPRPSRPPPATRWARKSAGRIIGLIVAGLVAVNLIGGLFSNGTGSTEVTDPGFGRSLDNPNVDAGGVSDDKPDFADGAAVPDELVIEGTGLPNTADVVVVGIVPSDQARHWYRAYGDGFLLENVMVAGVYEVRYPFDSYSTIVVEGEPTDARCVIRIDGTLAAHSNPMSSGRCVFDKATIANASPGE